jgi:hypothetical protein
MTWWESLDEYLAQRDESDAADGAPDPWGDVDLGRPDLTDEQIAYLAFDQPAVPRLGGVDPLAFEGDGAGPTPEPPGEPTGNSPGDG